MGARVVIDNVAPGTGDPVLAVKRVRGDAVSVEADIFADGHERLRAVLLWQGPSAPDWHAVEMTPLGNDRWQAVFTLEETGRHHFAIEAWRDRFGSWREEVEKKHAAGLPLAAEILEGVALLEAAGLKPPPAKDRLAALLSPQTREAMNRQADRADLLRSAEHAVQADRPAAAFAAWYELFPRSQSGDPARHGTFEDVIARLPAIKEMGFDVLYMPPIHPIGRINRKGRNNALKAGPGDPGSPYAIGAEEGGHDAVHPELGGIEGFRRLVKAAGDLGMEIAIDFAIQCSPDHPWLKEHPQWFAWRADGSIRYAENPPKKYEDIVNVDFYARQARPGLWEALRDVVLFWAKEGVRTFRVDNPHTKPFPFWQWMIAEVQARFPDAVFLSEAFTRPKVMQRLAKIGFTQSYTYFTWRNTKAELTEYMNELAHGPMREYFRPHFFVNTPDINPYFLQTGGRPGHLIRASLAATLSGLWGLYSGFELCEATPVPGKEEYLDSEKYEIRAWNWRRPGNIIAEIAALNRIRAENPALHTHLGLQFLNCWNDNIIAYARFTPARDNLLVVAVNLDPAGAHEADFEIPLWQLGLPDNASVTVDDLMRDARFTWTGKVQHMRLDPAHLPFAVWRLGAV